MSQNELTTVARQLLTVKAQIAQLEQEAEMLTNIVKGVMVDTGSEVMGGPGWMCSWKNVTASRFDAKKFKAENADVYQAYSKPITTCRFIIQATV